jgi:hypothetical protein
VLFAGTDAGSHYNLWVTNDTAAGTSELSVAGASANGVFASTLPAMTVLGSEALFAGYDASGHHNLFVTDGTSGGSSELSVAGAWSFGLNPTDLTVFGSEVLFSGVDASGNSHFWITNGTVAGTSELSAPGGSDLTVFGSEVLFVSGNTLWITDGTAAGTSELSIAGAGAFGLDAISLTVFGSEVLFEGSDASGHYNLWVTDGTSSGTSELSAAGANSLGLFNSRLPEFRVFGSEVLFSGVDASGHHNLWATDGTSGGTSEIAGNNSSLGIYPTDLTVATGLTVVLPPPVPSASTSTIVVSPSTVKADGTSAATVTVTVEDALGNVLPGTAVTLSASGTGNTFGAITGTTDAHGVFTTTLTSTVPQVETITATEGGVHEQTGVDFVTGLESVTASPASGTETPGQTVTFTLAMSGPVTVVGGPPVFILNDGGLASYDAAATAALHDPTKLVFIYNVGASTYEHNVGALTVQAINRGYILDQNGVVADFSGLVTAFPNLHVVVAPPATVTSVAASPASGVEGIGATIRFTVGLSKAVTVVGGTPTLTLNDGGLAFYDVAATASLRDPTKLVFTYKVAAAEHNVGVLTVQDSSLNGATVVDAAGNTPDLSGVATAFPNLEVVTSATVTSVVASPANGLEGVGATIMFTVGLSKAVTVSGGIPTLTLNDGGLAFYNAAATAALGDPTKLVFSYTVTASEHNVGALTVQDGSLNGAALVDAAGITPDFSGLATAFPGLEVVTAPPATVTSVMASPASGVEGVGATMAFTVTMSKAVTVAGGTPTLTLNDGGLAFYDAAATAALGDPTKLVFSYTVTASEHNVGALTVQDGSLNGATLVDAAGNTPDFSGLATAFPNLHVVTAAPATVTSVVASPSSGTEGAGQTITFTLTMSKAVTVPGGLPFLALNDAGRAIYDAAATAALGDPTKLVFDYTIAQTDQAVPALAIIGGSFNGATITDASGTIPDFSGGLISFPGLQTTAAPVLISIVASQASGELVTGNKEIITLNFGQPLVFTGGSPELLLNDSGTAFYDAAHSTSTALVFDYTVGAGDLTTDLKISGLQSTSAIAGRFDQGALLSSAGTDLGLQVNTTNTGPAGPSVGPFNVDNAQLALFGPSNAAVTFAPNASDVLILENSASFAGTVAGFASGETIQPVGTAIDFADINFKGSTLSYAPNADNTGGMLTVSDSITTANIALLGNYTAASFVKAVDNTGHTLVENFQALPL